MKKCNHPYVVNADRVQNSTPQSCHFSSGVTKHFHGDKVVFPPDRVNMFERKSLLINDYFFFDGNPKSLEKNI